MPRSPALADGNHLAPYYYTGRVFGNPGPIQRGKTPQQWHEIEHCSLPGNHLMIVPFHFDIYSVRPSLSFTLNVFSLNHFWIEVFI